jgi:toxin secretion/phage lysis holin
MKDIWNWIQLAIAAGGGVIGWFLGGLDGFVVALITVAVLDYISGFMCAVVEKTLSSEVGFRGIFKKVLIFCMVALGHVMDTHLIGAGSALRTAIIFFYIANEGLSLLENTTRLGLPVPDKLRDVLAQLHGKTEAQSPTDDERGEVVVPPHPGAETPTQNEQAETPPQNIKEAE